MSVFSKSVQSWSSSINNLGAASFLSPYHLIKCQCHQMQVQLAFCGSIWSVWIETFEKSTYLTIWIKQMKIKNKSFKISIVSPFENLIKKRKCWFNQKSIHIWILFLKKSSVIDESNYKNSILWSHISTSN